MIRHLAPLAVAAGFGEPDSSPRTWPHHTPLMLVPVGLMALVGIPAAVMVAAQTTLMVPIRPGGDAAPRVAGPVWPARFVALPGYE